jgi:iron complex outermembrane recepter protein
VSPLQVGGGEPGARNRARFERLQPKLTVSWRPPAPVLLYASLGEGFRSGQFNQNGVGAVAAAAGLLGVDDRTEAEVIRTLEFGAKSELLDQRLRINASVFDSRLEDTPYFVFIGAVAAQVLVGIDRVRIRGGELEAQWRLAEGLDIHAGVGVSESRILRYSLNPDAIGNRAPYVPDLGVTIGAQYRRALGAAHVAVGRLDYERRGRQYWDPENSSARSALDLLNLRIGVERQDRRWALMATLKNATDERYNAEWVAGGFAQAAAPRSWHVEVQRRF